VRPSAVRIAGDHAGEDRNHRQYAGRQREQQAEPDKDEYGQPQPAIGEGRGDFPLLGAVRRIGSGRRCGSRLDRAQVDTLLDRRVADADRVVAPLVRDFQARAGGRFALQRQADRALVVENLDLTEEWILFRVRRREPRFAELGTTAIDQAELAAIAVEVIVLRDRPVQHDGRIRLALGAQDKRLVRRQQIRLARVADAVSERFGDGGREREAGEQRDGREESGQEDGVVLPSIHWRNAGRPRVSGTATISGSSYGCSACRWRSSAG